MPKDRPVPAPRTFFLNEHHELAHAERAGGGRLPNLAPLDWAAKGHRLHQTLKSTQQQLLQRSKDPLSGRRFYLVAKGVSELSKFSKDKKKAPSGEYAERTNYRREHSQIFRRLGLDLIDVHEEGTATV